MSYNFNIDCQIDIVIGIKPTDFPKDDCIIICKGSDGNYYSNVPGAVQKREHGEEDGWRTMKPSSSPLRPLNIQRVTESNK